jgi:hypothetical protein
MLSLTLNILKTSSPPPTPTRHAVFPVTSSFSLSSYSHTLTLTPSLSLFYEVLYDDLLEVAMVLEGSRRCWVSLGFSMTSSMTNADMAICWVDKGSFFLSFFALFLFFPFLLLPKADNYNNNTTTTANNTRAHCHDYFSVTTEPPTLDTDAGGSDFPPFSFSGKYDDVTGRLLIKFVRNMTAKDNGKDFVFNTRAKYANAIWAVGAGVPAAGETGRMRWSDQHEEFGSVRMPFKK